MIIAVPVYYLDTMEYFPVEIQLRTMTMDLWASMEHRVCYKKLPEHREELAEAFCQYADILEKNRGTVWKHITKQECWRRLHLPKLWNLRLRDRNGN